MHGPGILQSDLVSSGGVCDIICSIPFECKLQGWLQRGDSRTKTRAQELVLDSSLWFPHVWRQRCFFSDSNNKEDTTETENGWTDITQSQPAPVIHRFTGIPSGLRQYDALNVNKDSPPLSVFMLFLHEIVQLLVEGTQLLPSILQHAWWRTFSAAWCDYTGHVLVSVYNCADGSWQKGQTQRLLVHTRTFFYDLLQKHNEMRQTCFKQHSTSKWFVFVAGFLTFINSYDVKLTTRIQNIFMFTKVAALGVIIIAGFAYLFMGK